MLQKFKELFCGLDVAYGEYYLNGERDSKTVKKRGGPQLNVALSLMNYFKDI
jgi:hypothetical protein